MVFEASINDLAFRRKIQFCEVVNFRFAKKRGITLSRVIKRRWDKKFAEGLTVLLSIWSKIGSRSYHDLRSYHGYFVIYSTQTFHEWIDKTNTFSCSYTTFAELGKSCGVDDWFNNEDTGKVRDHPGCFTLTQEDVTFITERKSIIEEELKLKHGKAYVYACDKKCDLEFVTWLEYWVRWAVETCETPAIHNT